MTDTKPTFPNRPASEVLLFPEGRPDDRYVARAFECPDCDSEITRIDHGGGVEEILVCHDDTCPVLNGVTA